MKVFTTVSLVIAVLGTLLGGMMVIYGWNHSTAADPALVAHANRQLDAGGKLFLASLMLGVLGEISLALHRR